MLEKQKLDLEAKAAQLEQEKQMLAEMKAQQAAINE